LVKMGEEEKKDVRKTKVGEVSSFQESGSTKKKNGEPKVHQAGTGGGKKKKTPKMGGRFKRRIQRKG